MNIIDTFFKANRDSIFWFNPQTKNFEPHSSFLEKGISTIDQAIILLESFDGKFILFPDHLLEQTNSGFQKISFDELAFRNPENIQLLKDYNLNISEARKVLVSSIYFPRRMSFFGKLNCTYSYKYQNKTSPNAIER